MMILCLLIDQTLNIFSFSSGIAAVYNVFNIISLDQFFYDMILIFYMIHDFCFELFWDDRQGIK